MALNEKLPGINAKTVAFTSLSPSIVKKYHVLPLELVDEVLYLGMSEPDNIIVLDDISLLTGYDVHPITMDADHLAAEISHLYGPLDIIADHKGDNTLGSDILPSLTLGTGSEISTSNIIDSLFQQAIEFRASDIHLEPTDRGGEVRFRIDGALHTQATLDNIAFKSTGTAIKAAAGMDIAQCLLPQDGRMEIRLRGKRLDVRLASLPTVKGEKLVLRLLDGTVFAQDIKALGFTPTIQTQLQHFASQSSGMLVVAGPTGCGKSTTLYAILQQINSREQNIVTIEDPVEYDIPGINQVQVNPKAGLGFASGLRAILRQDPNVIMIGEMRDSETAQIAVRAALTGHLVLTTLHTKDAVSAITRLHDMGIEPYLLASAINGIVCQRLVRSICPACKQHYCPNELEEALLQRFTDTPVGLSEGQGCPLCRYSGYKDRIPIAEVLTVSPAIRQLIYAGDTEVSMAATAKKEGMICIQDDGLLKTAAGLTTVREILRTIN